MKQHFFIAFVMLILFASQLSAQEQDYVWRYNAMPLTNKEMIVHSRSFSWGLSDTDNKNCCAFEVPVNTVAIMYAYCSRLTETSIPALKLMAGITQCVGSVPALTNSRFGDGIDKISEGLNDMSLPSGTGDVDIYWFASRDSYLKFRQTPTGECEKFYDPKYDVLSQRSGTHKITLSKPVEKSFTIYLGLLNKDMGDAITVRIEAVAITAEKMPTSQAADPMTTSNVKKDALPVEMSTVPIDAPQYGSDSTRCIRIMSNFAEYCKQNAWEEAYPFWVILFTEYPKCSQTIYSNGVNIIKKKMQVSKNGKEQQMWVDVLMMVYDQRIKFFAAHSKLYKEAYILGRKGVDLFKYRKNPVEDPYNILMKAIDLGGKDSEYAVIQTAMQSVIAMYDAHKIDASVVGKKYLLFTKLLAQKKADDKAKLESASNDKDKEKAKNALETCAQVEKNISDLFTNSITN